LRGRAAIVDKLTILNRLDLKAFYTGELPSIKANGDSRAMALCPWHDDQNPSLSVNLDTGHWKCHAGCGGGSIFDFQMKKYDVDFLTAKKALAEKAGLTPEIPRHFIDTYDYTDEAGNLIFQVVRYKPKGFSQRRPDGKGGWLWNLKDVRLVPYNLCDVLKADTVFIAEGEKDVHTLRDLGLVGSCNAQGAGKWRPEYNNSFKNKRVAILRDNDEPGRNHALQVAGNLKGIADSVKLINLPGLSEKGDVTDWIKAGGTKERLLEIIRNTPEWKPTAEEVPGIVRLETIKPQKVNWLWDGYLPLGKPTIIDGNPGVSKSLFTVHMAARVTSTGIMPDGSQGMTGGVVLMSLEDGLADTVVPRLELAGGDKKKIVSIQGVPDALGNLRFPTVADVEHIGRACDCVNARLVIIDPVMGYLGGVNSWKDQDIRAALAPLVKFAEERNVAVLIVRHLNKSTSAQAINRGGGSIGFIGLARMGFLIAADPEDENKRILAGVKSNLAPLPPSLSYRIEDYDGVPRIVWGGISNHTADALLSVPCTPEERSALEDAKDFLRDLLDEGAVPANEVIREARKAGVSDRTLNRAKKVLGVVSMKGLFREGWKWSLPTKQEEENGDIVDLTGTEVEIVG
jgi:putative DNA primase/helicase